MGNGEELAKLLGLESRVVGESTMTKGIIHRVGPALPDITLSEWNASVLSHTSALISAYHNGPRTTAWHVFSLCSLAPNV